MSADSSSTISYRLNVTEARDLSSKDFNGLSDPYVKIRWNGQKFKTEIKKKTLNPRWSAEFHLKPSPDDASMEEIIVEVWDHDVVTSDELIGAVALKLKDWLKSDSTAAGWYTLSKPKKKSSPCGEIHLSITKVIGGAFSASSAPGTPSNDANGKPIKKAYRISDSKEKSKKRSESGSKSSSSSSPAAPPKPVITVVECEIPSSSSDDTPPLQLLPHHKDRLADLRRIAQIPPNKMKTTSVFGTPVMESYFVIVNQIKPKLSVVKVNNQELKSLYQQYFAAIRDEERDSISKRVDELIQQTNKNFTAISVSMRQLNDSNTKFDKLDPKTVGESSRNEKRVRTNVTTILARCFLENMIQFQDAQQQFKSMHTTRVKQLYLISNPSASQTDLDDLASMDLSVSEVFEQKFSATRHKAAQQALAYVKDKHKDILAIENGLRELQELFNQCAALVALQREFIDQIAANIDRTYESIKASNQELYQARYYQKHRFALSAPQYDRLYKN